MICIFLFSYYIETQSIHLPKNSSTIIIIVEDMGSTGILVTDGSGLQKRGRFGSLMANSSAMLVNKVERHHSVALRIAAGGASALKRASENKEKNTAEAALVQAQDRHHRQGSVRRHRPRPQLLWRACPPHLRLF